MRSWRIENKLITKKCAIARALFHVMKTASKIPPTKISVNTIFNARDGVSVPFSFIISSCSLTVLR